MPNPIWTCQQKTLDDERYATQYARMALTAVNSRAAIRSAIAAAGMTQEAVAEALHRSPVTVSRWLTGVQDPSFAVLDELAAVLGQPLLLTFGTEEEALPPPWARGLEERLTVLLIQNRGVFDGVVEALASYGYRQALDERSAGEDPPETQADLPEPAAPRTGR